ncbi:unnamed protein product [Triticum aestivum]|uniref:DUF4220 domain-containing protein n=1 Tax=Triticum aestivum TaxID=4565 RepID=A0A7H4LRJ8_WHEAT|nr:unnamed protein product [Triticum aestivum]
MDGHQVAMNRTKALEALSPFLENPRQIVIQNEAFVVLAAAMLFLQLMLGPWRRRSGHLFVQGTLWVAYTVSFPLITYTLGQMVTSPVKNMLYPVWAVILLWASGRANAFTAYNIEDNKQWKRYLFEILQYFVYLAIILKLFHAGPGLTIPERIISTQPITLSLSVLTSLVLMANLHRVLAGWMVTNSTPSKLVADYMRAQVQVNTRSRAAQEETFTMSGCKYLVCPPFNDLRNSRVGHRVITIGTIWDTFDGDSLVNKQLRDVCLSFALSKLLLRRYFGLDCAEAGLPKTLQFALEGLLPEVDQVNHYSRAFHVIEVELGFLYDFFFTKHATLLSFDGSFLFALIVKLICVPFAGVCLIAYPPTVNTFNPIIEVGTRRVDVTVTVVIMGALLLFDVLQAIHYLTSDWATISLVCSNIRFRRHTSRLISSIISSTIPSIFRFLRRFEFAGYLGRRIIIFGYWQNKMGQSSVIGGNLLVNYLYVSHDSAYAESKTVLVLPIYNLIHSMMFSMKNFVPVSDLVKSNIIFCLRIYGNGGGPLTNGKAALERNKVLEDFSSTLENDSQITVMLIWHIATEYCNIASSDGAQGLHSGAQQVATTLSKYCAYLMYFVPELLAENSTDTLFIVHEVLEQVEDALGGDKPTKDRLLRVIQDSDGPDNHSTVIDIPPVSSNMDNIIHDSISSNNNTDNIIHDSRGSNNTDNIIHNSSGNNGHTATAQDSATNGSEDSILIKGLKLGRDLEAKDSRI